MKIAISSTGADLDDLVDPRFSKCRYYIFVDTDTRQTKVVENPTAFVCVFRDTTTGNLVAGEKTDVVLTGHIGSKSAKILLAAGVRIYTGVSGKISDALEAFQSGRLEELMVPPPGASQ
jgi:predicted Fe-Mo cluster-binding NifX family protein